jgi:hypothetical protein
VLSQPLGGQTRLATFNAVNHSTRRTAAVYILVAGDVTVVWEGPRGNRRVKLVRTGNGAAYVYIGATENFERRDKEALPSLPQGVTWTRRMPVQGRNANSGYRVPVVTHGMGYAPPGTELTLDQLFIISSVEAFLIGGVRGIFGYNPNHRGEGYAAVRNKSPYGPMKCALTALLFHPFFQGGKSAQRHLFCCIILRCRQVALSIGPLLTSAALHALQVQDAGPQAAASG